jgi:hypothetical protein
MSRIRLEIVASSYIYAKESIEELDTKRLVPKMVQRRRLTRAAKIALYLADRVGYGGSERILYGSCFGELDVTAKILKSIKDNEPISPTHFQNSVYNTAVSYLSMLSDNQQEIVTISSGDTTSLNLLKSAAIKALDGDTLLLIATETLNMEGIEELNHCLDYLECGVAMRVRLTEQAKSLEYGPLDGGYPLSMQHMLSVAKAYEESQSGVIEVVL